MKDLTLSLKQRTFYRHGNYRNPFLFNYLACSSLTKEHFVHSGVSCYLNPLVAINSDHYVDESNAALLVDGYHEHMRLDASFFDRYYQAHFGDYSNLLHKARDIASLPYTRYAKKELLGVLQEWFDDNVTHLHWLWNMEFVNLASDRIIKETITLHTDNFDNTLVVLGEPSEDIDAIKARSLLLEQALAVKKGKSALTDVTHELEQTYGWLEFNAWHGRPLDAAHFEQKINEIIERDLERELENLLRERTLRKDQYTRTRALFPPEVRGLLDDISKLVYLKSLRIEMISKSMWYLYDFVQHIAERIDVAYDDFFYLRPDEIYRLLDGDIVDWENIEKRKSSFAVVWLDELVHTFVGTEVDRIRDVVAPHVGDVETLTGTTAYPGSVTGVVKVVNNESEIGKVNQGDILVAPMTNPNYDPVLGKVSGMIADEGGILSHTTIVAREYKIPTIIGTKIATQVFNDGDVIELDAQRGSATIIKKSTEHLV